MHVLIRGILNVSGYEVLPEGQRVLQHGPSVHWVNGADHQYTGQGEGDAVHSEGQPTDGAAG